MYKDQIGNRVPYLREFANTSLNLFLKYVKCDTSN